MAIAKIDGFQDGGTAVEPTTGNNVPVGALPNEVADDIDAKLSEGEFVIPADVVRFIGLERLMKLRDDAKRGLQRMAEIGQMGNAEEVGEKAESTFEEGEEEDTGQFESDIDELLAEEDSTEGQTERMMAVGGLASSYASGFDMSKAPKNPVFDVRYLKHGDGRMMYITYINGKPMTPIPDGFREITREEAVSAATAADEARRTKPAEGAAGATEGGGDLATLNAKTTEFLDKETTAERNARMAQVNDLLTNIAKQTMPYQAAQALANVFTSQVVKAQAQQDIIDREDTSSAVKAQAQQDIIDREFPSDLNAPVSAPSPAAPEPAAITSPVSDYYGSPSSGTAGTVGYGGAGDVGGGYDGGYGSDAGFGEGSGLGYQKGGLVGKRKPKAKRGKGLVAQK